MARARPAKGSRFVKSAETDVPVDKTREEIRTLVRKYGASGFGVSEDYEKRQSVITLMVPDLPGEPARVPLRIPVDVARVYSALYEGRQANQFSKDPAHRQKRQEQAERTAWRHAFYTIEVALMAAQLGGRPISESLMAAVVVVHDDGRQERMAELMRATGGALAPGVRALIPPPARQEESSHD